METQVLTNEELREVVEEKNRIMREGTRKAKRLLIVDDLLRLIEGNTVTVGHMGFVRFNPEAIREMPSHRVSSAGDPELPRRIDSKEIQKAFERAEILQNCTVCALGGLVVSAVRLFDGFSPAVCSTDFFDARHLGEFSSSAEDGNLIGLLAEYFDEQQLAMIECAYEQGAGFYADDSPFVKAQSDVTQQEEWDEEDVEVNCEDGMCRQNTHYVRLVHSAEEKRVPPSWWTEAKEFGEMYPNRPAERLKAIMENIKENDGEFIPA